MSASGVDAIGIGCRRCGSSFLHEVLNSHPDIAKPPRGLHFFSENAGKGVEWYLTQLPPRSPGGIVLEYSISYTYPEFAEQAAEGVLREFPHARLFCTIRNPIDRAYSDYLRSQRHLEIPNDTTFEEAISAFPALLERGRYAQVLKPYFDRFPREQIHLMLFDDLLQDVQSFLDSLFCFLGVKTGAVRNLPKPGGEHGRRLRSGIFQAALVGAKNTLDNAAGTVGLQKPWIRMKRALIGPYRALRAMNTAEAAMSATTRARLRSYYAADIEWLASVLKRSLDGWT